MAQLSDLSLQTHHVYSTLKRRGNGRFRVASTWNTCGVFEGIMAEGGAGVAGIAKAIAIVIKSYKTNNTFLIEFRTGYSNVKEILRLPLHCHCHLVSKIGIIKPSHSPPSEVYCKLSWLAGVQR